MSTVFDVFLANDAMTSTATWAARMATCGLVPDLDRLVPWPPNRLGVGAGRPVHPGRRCLAGVPARFHRRMVDGAARPVWSSDGHRGGVGGQPRRRRRVRTGRARSGVRDDPADRARRLRPRSCWRRWRTRACRSIRSIRSTPTASSRCRRGRRPVRAADDSVLVRQHDPGAVPAVRDAGVVRAVGGGGSRRQTGATCTCPRGANGRDAFAGGTGPHGMTADEGRRPPRGSCGICPALLAIGAPSPASYLRLVPSHWAGVFALLGTGDAGDGAAAGDRERGAGGHGGQPRGQVLRPRPPIRTC
jgi:glutamine synthetase